MDDETTVLRRRLEEAELALARAASRDAKRRDARLVQVYSGGAIPTTIGKFCLIHPAVVLPGATEGSSATISVDTSLSAPVDAIGPAAPSVGDYMIAWGVDYRAAGMKGSAAGGGTVAVPGCTCSSIPSTLGMMVANSALSYGILQSCTLQWGTTPAWAARLSLGASCFLSTATFADQHSPDRFYYYFACLGGYFILTRVYQTSVYGSPYRDTIRYKWLVGNPGNGCSPFTLLNGLIYPGGDPLCTASIS